jgi:CRP-like cAMP-binding protein
VGIFILHKGTVTLSSMSQDGHSLLAAQARPGSILGLPGAISNEPYSLSATAAAGAEVCFVSREDLTALMHANPAMSIKMLQVLAAEVRSARKALN